MANTLGDTHTHTFTKEVGSQERCLSGEGADIWPADHCTGWGTASVWGWGCCMVWWGCRWIDQWLETVETQYSFSLLPCCCLNMCVRVFSGVSGFFQTNYWNGLSTWLKKTPISTAMNLRKSLNFKYLNSSSFICHIFFSIGTLISLYCFSSLFVSGLSGWWTQHPQLQYKQISVNVETKGELDKFRAGRLGGSTSFHQHVGIPPLCQPIPKHKHIQTHTDTRTHTEPGVVWWAIWLNGLSSWLQQHSISPFKEQMADVQQEAYVSMNTHTRARTHTHCLVFT